MIPAEVVAWVAETRARQGLPPTITDPPTVMIYRWWSRREPDPSPHRPGAL